MLKVFTLSELIKIVAPYELQDVLESLLENGLIDGYELDFTMDECAIDIPKDMEINEVMRGFEAFADKRTRH